MTDEEIKAIERLKSIDENTEEYDGNLFKTDFETVLNLIQKQKEEIEYYKSQKRYDDQFKHELLEEIRCKSLTIDSLNKILDDRLICIQGGRGLYAKLKGLDKEYLIREYLSMYKMCKQEIEKKNRQLEERTNRINNLEKECQKYFEQGINKDKIIDNAIIEIEKLRQYFSEDLQPDFIRILEILKDKKVIDW